MAGPNNTLISSSLARDKKTSKLREGEVWEGDKHSAFARA